MLVFGSLSYFHIVVDLYAEDYIGMGLGSGLGLCAADYYCCDDIVGLVVGLGVNGERLLGMGCGSLGMEVGGMGNEGSDWSCEG